MQHSSNKTPNKPFRSRSELTLRPSTLLDPHKQQLARTYKLPLSCVGLLDSLKHHRGTPDAKLVHALHPQLHKKTLENVYRVNKSRSLKQILQSKLKTQEQRMHELKMRDEIRQKEIAQNRKMQTRQRQRQIKKASKQAEQQRELERSWRKKTLQRQKSQSSFLRETRRDSIGMLRHSRIQQNKSQRSLAQEELRQTVRSSKYNQARHSLHSRKEHYQKEYRKAFLKNTKPPNQDLPEAILYRSLKEKAQKITETYALPQHLPQISKRSPSRRSLKENPKPTQRLEKELMISSMRPTDRKQRTPNPETPPLLPPTDAKEAPSTPVPPPAAPAQPPVPVATVTTPQQNTT